jgi:UrcA family protein
MNINLKNVAFSAVAFVCSAIVMNSAAAGGPIGETLKQKVSYSDLNLDRPEGIEALYKRVHSAAANLCAPAGTRDTGGLAYTVQPCIADATSRAVATINNPALTAYSNSRNGIAEGGLVAGQP